MQAVMEENWRHRSLLDDRCRKNRDSPSFSSTLLDAIYRSIDEGGGQEEADKGLELYKQAMRKKHPQQHRHINNNNSNCSAAVRGNAAAEAKEGTEKGSLRRAMLIEKWLQKKEVVTGPATAAAAVDFEKTDARRRRGSGRDKYSPLVHSSSSSSDSSCGGGFSSSEAESIHGVSDLHGALKPVRTRTRTSTTTTAPIVSPRINGSESHRSYTHHDHHQKSATPPVRPKKNEGAFSKTKSKVPLKMYGDLKTVKQPISPGARLAGFLNSLLPAKKPKTTLPSSSLRNVNGDADPNPERKSKHSAPACSSASSFSRSCLSLTPSAREKLGSRGAGTGKISVRLGPATPTPVVDQDPSARGHKKVYGIRPISLAAAVTKAARDSSAVANNNHKLVNRHDAEDVLKACHRRHHHYHHQKLNKKDDELSIKPESDLEDDVSSCSSLDLFELDHLSAIGMHRYREELPVD